MWSLSGVAVTHILAAFAFLLPETSAWAFVDLCPDFLGAISGESWASSPGLDVSGRPVCSAVGWRWEGDRLSGP